LGAVEEGCQCGEFLYRFGESVVCGGEEHVWGEEMETEREGGMGGECSECFDQDICRFFNLCVFRIELVPLTSA
jgi:hypothetical protein